MMSESPLVPVEQNQSSGQDQEASFEEKRDVVQYDTYKKVLSEKKKRDEQLRELLARNEQLELASKEREEAELRQKEDYKSLLTKRDEELHTLKSRLEQEEHSRHKMMKFSALFKALPGDVKQSYWDILPVDQIELDDSGMPDESSVKKVADLIQSTYPEIISSKAKGPDVPAKSPISATAGQDNKAALLEKFARLNF